MRKYALLTLVTALSFVFVGCVSSAHDWSKGLRHGDDREATVCDKETAQVPTPENPEVMQTEYRLQLTWHDVERGTYPTLWSVVDEETYKATDRQDKVTLIVHDFGQKKGHVTVIYYWVHDKTFEISEFKYEFDLPEDPYPR